MASASCAALVLDNVCCNFKVKYLEKYDIDELAFVKLCLYCHCLSCMSSLQM